MIHQRCILCWLVQGYTHIYTSRYPIRMEIHKQVDTVGDWGNQEHLEHPEHLGILEILEMALTGNHLVYLVHLALPGTLEILVGMG